LKKQQFGRVRFYAQGYWGIVDVLGSHCTGEVGVQYGRDHDPNLDHPVLARAFDLGDDADRFCRAWLRRVPQWPKGELVAFDGVIFVAWNVGEAAFGRPFFYIPSIHLPIMPVVC
jgi:hypothetical protein